MLLISFLKWWYGRGFLGYLKKFSDGLKDSADFFSIRLLVRHMFAPFREISAGKRDNLPLGERIHAWADLMVSRLIGATVRFGLLVAGIVVILVRAGVGIVLAVAWPLAPLGIAYSVMLYVRGVVF